MCSIWSKARSTMEQKQFMVCYINPNYWYEQYQQQYALQMAIPTGEVPIGSSTHNNPKLGKLGKPAVTKMCLLVSFVIAVAALLLLTGVGVGLYYALKPNTTTTTTTTMAPDSLLWPYGPDAGDEEVDIQETYLDTSATGSVSVFGKSYQQNAIFVTVDSPIARIQITDATTFAPPMQTFAAASGESDYDDTDPAKERFCYSRKTSSDADKERLCRLIGGDVFTLAKPFNAYVFTFTNYTIGDEPIGTFQNILVLADPKLYLIRSYETIKDIPNLTSGQFPVFDWVNAVVYETSTVAADVRGKTQVFDLTDAGTGTNLNDAAPSTASGCA